MTLVRQVVIIGAGPAGLMLGHALTNAGVDCVVLDRQSAAHVLGRVRAGVLERGTTELMRELGLAGRLDREGIIHDGLTIVHDGAIVRIDLAKRVGGHVTVYGQTEITRDLIDAAPGRSLEVRWSVADVALHDIEGDTPFLTFTEDGRATTLSARFIVGCDGFHGIARKAIPAAATRIFERAYPFGWLGILADVPPCHDEVVYASHARGFALASMRSATRSRCYIQVPIDTRLEDWPDERFWDEFALRIGPELAGAITRGPSFEKSIAPLRSYVFEPMRYRSLFLAGDAAHIVPPTGAKGLNLAMSDVTYLAEALTDYFGTGSTAAIDGYSGRALARVWKSERFSWYLTKLLHRFPDDNPFEQRMQAAELDYIAASDAAQTMIAENYIGLPL